MRSCPIDARTSPFSPETEALGAIPRASLVIVDFDETLYLRNSTEDFLARARPAWLAAVMLRLLDFCSPWRWTGGAITRDFWRVRVILALFPWTMGHWHRICADQAARHTNNPLLEALRAGPAPYLIASSGFTRVIRPLLDAMGCPDIRLIACSLANPADRAGGKLALIQSALGTAPLTTAMVITDSAADADILAVCAQPCLTKWRAARFERAFAQTYLPGDYLAQVKRPTEPGVLRRLLLEDLLLWLLIATPMPSLLAPIGITLLFCSLWSVYETGYRDNDRCAQKFEADPVVSPEFFTYVLTNFEPKAWTSAGLLGLAGLLTLHPRHLVHAAITWAAILLALRATFWLYNRIDKPTRIWLYPVLQFFRSLALILIIPVPTIGIIAGLSQIFARWQEYLAYRAPRAAAHWRQSPARLLQFGLFTLCLAAFSFAPSIPHLWTWRTAALLAWSLILARKDLRAALSNARRLDKVSP